MLAPIIVAGDGVVVDKVDARTTHILRDGDETSKQFAGDSRVLPSDTIIEILRHLK